MIRHFDYFISHFTSLISPPSRHAIFRCCRRRRRCCLCLMPVFAMPEEDVAPPFSFAEEDAAIFCHAAIAMPAEAWLRSSCAARRTGRAFFRRPPSQPQPPIVQHLLRTPPVQLPPMLFTALPQRHGFSLSLLPFSPPLIFAMPVLTRHAAPVCCFRAARRAALEAAASAAARAAFCRWRGGGARRCLPARCLVLPARQFCRSAAPCVVAIEVSIVITLISLSFRCHAASSLSPRQLVAFDSWLCAVLRCCYFHAEPLLRHVTLFAAQLCCFQFRFLRFISRCFRHGLFSVSIQLRRCWKSGAVDVWRQRYAPLPRHAQRECPPRCCSRFASCCFRRLAFID